MPRAGPRGIGPRLDDRGYGCGLARLYSRQLRSHDARPGNPHPQRRGAERSVLGESLVRSWWALNLAAGWVAAMRHRSLTAGRDSGLRRLSRITWRTTLLSVVTAFGMATLFSKTANSAAGTASSAQTRTSSGQSTGPSASPSASGSSRSPSPSASARKSARATASPTAAPTTNSAPNAGTTTHAAQPTAAPTTAAPKPAPKPTVAPPTTPPAPSPTPAPTTSHTSTPSGG